jgi:hypothetical protein
MSLIYPGDDGSAFRLKTDAHVQNSQRQITEHSNFPIHRLQNLTPHMCKSYTHFVRHLLYQPCYIPVTYVATEPLMNHIIGALLWMC